MTKQQLDPVREAILTALAGTFDDTTRMWITDEIARDQLKEAAALAGGKDLVLSDLINRNRFYAIHNEDIEFLKESVATAAAIYTGLPNPVAVIGGLVLLLYRFRKKSIQLTGREALVLNLIAHAGRDGVNRDALQRTLSQMGNAECMRASRSLDAILKRLQNARRRDNTAAPLIEEKDAKLYSLDV
jgi:hypothetical protein